MIENHLRRIRGNFLWVIPAVSMALLPATALAQAAPPEAGAPPADAQAAAAKAAEMARPLMPADKKFIKEASELL